MKLVAITTKSGKNYTIGHNPDHLADDLIIESITFHRPGKLYNGGFQTSQPGYSVAVVDNAVRRLVPEHEVAEVWVDINPAKKKKQDGEVPEMENFLAETTDDEGGQDEA